MKPFSPYTFLMMLRSMKNNKITKTVDNHDSFTRR